jgi:integrase
MIEAKIQWTRTRQDELLSKVQGYWAADVWIFGDCPIKNGNWNSQGYRLTREQRFTCVSSRLNMELKYVCWQKLERGEWKTGSCWKNGQHLTKLCRFINAVAPNTNSFLERPLKQWEILFRTFLLEHGLLREQVKQELNKNNELVSYKTNNADNIFLNVIYKTLKEDYDERDEWDKEIWNALKLGIPINLSRSDYAMNFEGIGQSWLYNAARKYLRYNITINSWGNSQRKLGIIKDFSLHLLTNYPDTGADSIDRQLVIDYFSKLNQTGLKSSTRHYHVSTLQNFFELCAREEWMDIPDKRLIYREDYPRKEKALPRYIPEEVMTTLNQHIDKLPNVIMRMLLVIQEVGMRVSELCGTPYDCLLRDAEGDYFFKYYQGKQKKEHTVPISAELVGVIIEQQQFIRSKFSTNCPYLFVYPDEEKPRSFKQDYFGDALNRLSYKEQIKNNAGKVWRFQAHQFRHTVGTRMINLGVPQHIVQRFLGHASPEMTATYATIHDKTMKTKFFEFKEKLVNVTGNIVTPESLQVEMAEGLDPNDIDSQWLKKNTLAQALPNGLCAIPVVQGSCPWGSNKCLTGNDGSGCTHFKTDRRYLTKHHEHLERVNGIIDWALQNPDSRRSKEILKENIPVRDNLMRIINGLEIKHEA